MRRSEWLTLAPIPQTPEERREAIEASVRRALHNRAEWCCPIGGGCDFHRWAETRGGMFRVAARHLHDAHRIRLEVR